MSVIRGNVRIILYIYPLPSAACGLVGYLPEAAAFTPRSDGWNRLWDDRELYDLAMHYS